MRVKIVRIYDKSYATVKAWAEPFKDEAPAIPEAVLVKFIERLSMYKYELIKNNNSLCEYLYSNSKYWSLKVQISKNEIAFTAPRTKSFNSSLVFECLQTASELCDTHNLAIYFSKDRDWIN
ncbi:hypothetical protein [Zooshikella sp. RANM57]|uniref:hypothetical protein n=1 Tax=Zooshikella sp. RANM57 TaxID=3425863 RepID=UPI003D6E7541